MFLDHKCESSYLTLSVLQESSLNPQPHPAIANLGSSKPHIRVCSQSLCSSGLVAQSVRAQRLVLT